MTEGINPDSGRSFKGRNSVFSPAFYTAPMPKITLLQSDEGEDDADVAMGPGAALRDRGIISVVFLELRSSPRFSVFWSFFEHSPENYERVLLPGSMAPALRRRSARTPETPSSVTATSLRQPAVC